MQPRLASILLIQFSSGQTSGGMERPATMSGGADGAVGLAGGGGIGVGLENRHSGILGGGEPDEEGVFKAQWLADIFPD